MITPIIVRGVSFVVIFLSFWLWAITSLFIPHGLLMVANFFSWLMFIIFGLFGLINADEITNQINQFLQRRR